MATRADRIEGILRQKNARMRVSELTEQLEELEQSTVNQSTVSATVLQDNARREKQGIVPRFDIYGDGTEERGWVSARQGLPSQRDPTSEAEADATAAEVIEKENAIVREKLKSAIRELSWQDFESNFLLLVLEALGFHQVQLTQKTRDGGVDAYCSYRRGIVDSQAIVSAKHWKSRDVAADEAQRLRGIKGAADTGIIVTSSTFSDAATSEAEPSQNQRSIVLVDGDLIVATCLSNSIGVDNVKLPVSFRFVGFGPENAS
jgi:restriction system protein